MPGLNEGVSGSMAEGDNMGISKYLPEKKREAALEVIKFLSSKEYQRGILKNLGFPTALSELLNDEEVCKKAKCDLLNEIQFTGEPLFIRDGPDDFRKKYKKYLYQYLYENKTVDETTKKIIDLSKIYYVSLDMENTCIGLIYFIFISVVTVLMLLSLILLFNDKFNKFFIYLPTEFWIINVLGSILILWIPLFNYGQIKPFKCHLKALLLSIGYTLNLGPVLYKLISEFPKKNKIINWINNHRYIFLILNILIDVLVNSISFINPYTIKQIGIEDGEKFEICNFKGEINIITIIVNKSLMLLLLLLLVFIEWNISETRYEMRFITSAIYIDILSIILIVVFHHIQIKNYLSLFVIQTINIAIIAIGNYIFLYFARLFVKIKKEGLKIEEISKNHFNFVIMDTKTMTITKESNDSEDTNDNRDSNKYTIY